MKIKLPLRSLGAIYLILCLLLLCGCTSRTPSSVQVAATTLPAYEFTSQLCQGTDIEVTRLVTESVSCLHDYTLHVSQMRTIENAQAVVISGAGLEEFLGDTLDGSMLIDASAGISLLHPEDEHEHAHAHEHSHEGDPHIWLSPSNARKMAQTICDSLTQLYPAYTDTFFGNLSLLNAAFDALEAYAEEALSSLSCREMVTFHDGFSYFADAFGLEILHAAEEESGSEASASEIIEIVQLVKQRDLPAIFTETNGSTAAASVIASETGIRVFVLDMAMAGDSYFEAMYYNIDTIKEALG